MEGTPVRDVIQNLSKGLDLSSADEVKFEQQILEKGEKAFAPPDHAGDLASHLLHISTICNEFLKSVEYDSVECGKMDELWKIVDGNLIEYNIENIENISECIGQIIDKRKAKLSELEKVRLTEQYANDS